MPMSKSANWIGAAPGVVHLENDQNEGAVRDVLQGSLIASSLRFGVNFRALLLLPIVLVVWEIVLITSTR